MSNWEFSLSEDRTSYAITAENGRVVASVKLWDDAWEICESHNKLVAVSQDALDE